MKELSAYDVFSLVQEAQFLVGGKVDGIYQMDQKDLFLQVYIKDTPKQLLRIIAGKCFYLSSQRPQFPDNLQRFCTFLRKYLLNSRIASFEQVGHERIIKIVLQTKDTSYDLFVELFGKGNIILAKNNTIISVTEEQIWADREVKPGIAYTYPQKADAEDVFNKYKAKGAAMTMAQLDAELQSSLAATKKSTAHDKEVKKLQTIIDKQTQQLRAAEKDALESKQKAELIYARFEELQSMIATITSMKGKPWSEIKTVLKKNPAFKDVLEKEGILVVNVNE